MLSTIRSNTIPYKCLSDLLPLLADEETGIIRRVYELPRKADMPDLFYYKAELGNTARGTLPDNHPTAGGTSRCRDRALIKAVGEAVERYSSAIYFPEELVFGSYRSLSPQALSPERFRIFEKWQFAEAQMPLQPFEADTPIAWRSARNLHTGGSVLVPAALVYCPYEPDHRRGEVPIAETISTGLAAHCNLENASLNGIMEVVERDSFMITWLTRAKRPHINLTSLTVEHKDLIERYRVLGYQVTLLDNTLDTGIPSIIAAMYGLYPGSVPFMVAAAAHPDPTVAVTKSLEELALMERYCKQMMDTERMKKPKMKATAVNHLKDHVQFWLNARQLPKAAFLTASREQIDLKEISSLDAGQAAQTLSFVLDRIQRTGFEVFIADVTTSDIEALGIYVLRALIPGYLPLSKSYHCRPVGAERLKSFLNKEGVKDSVNPFPHPFA